MGISKLRLFLVGPLDILIDLLGLWLWDIWPLEGALLPLVLVFTIVVNVMILRHARLPGLGMAIGLSVGIGLVAAGSATLLSFPLLRPVLSGDSSWNFAMLAGTVGIPCGLIGMVVLAVSVLTGRAWPK
jgi:hypothetical protein